MRFKNVEHIDLCVADIIHLFLHILFYLINMYLRFTVQEKNVVTSSIIVRPNTDPDC